MKEYDENFINKLIRITEEYNMFIALHETKGKCYVVASDSEIPENVKADEIARVVESNPSLFFVHDYSICIEDGKENYIVNEVLDYAKKNEVIRTLYPEYDLPVPERVTTQEVNALMRFNLSRFNPDYPVSLQLEYGKELNKFFKAEKKKGIYKSWMNYNRSERFNSDASFLNSVKGYVKRNSNEVDLQNLVRNADKLETIEINERLYQEFKEFIHEYFPEVVYYAHEKDVIDWGQIKIPKNLEGVVESPYENQQRYWESRQITFKSSDAPVVHKVLNSIIFENIDNPLQNLTTILNRGDYCIEKIPFQDIANVSSLAKANNVKIYIDVEGQYSTPEATNIAVLYNAFDKQMMAAIMNRLFDEKSEFSHAIVSEQKKTLHERLSETREKQKVKQKSDLSIEKDRNVR